MKIVILSPKKNLSGGQRVISIYASYLSRKGYEVEVVCFDIPNLSKLEKIKSVFTKKKEILGHYDSYNIKHETFNKLNVEAVHKLQSADIAIATFWTTAIILNEVKLKAKKFYLIQHDEGYMFGEKAEETYSYDFKHIYISDWIRDRIITRHPEADGTVINNAIDNYDYFVKREKPKFLTVGTLWAGDTIKGGDIAIEVIKKLKKEVSLKFVVFGAVKPDAHYMKFIDEFYLTPSQNEICRIYSMCTVWLFTSRFEGYGLPLLEAYREGTLLIATKTGMAEHVIADNDYLVEIDDVESIVNKVKLVNSLTDNDWKKYSHTCQTMVKKLSWDVNVEKLVEFITY